jgi:hypothetical protein
MEDTFKTNLEKVCRDPPITARPIDFVRSGT